MPPSPIRRDLKCVWNAQAIQLAPENHVLWANRAACHGCLANWAAAEADALACTERSPEYVKGWFR